MASLPELGHPEVSPDVAKRPLGAKSPRLRTAALGYTFDRFTSLSLSINPRRRHYPYFSIRGGN